MAVRRSHSLGARVANLRRASVRKRLVRAHTNPSLYVASAQYSIPKSENFPPHDECAAPSCSFKLLLEDEPLCPQVRNSMQFMFSPMVSSLQCLKDHLGPPKPSTTAAATVSSPEAISHNCGGSFCPSLANQLPFEPFRTPSGAALCQQQCQQQDAKHRGLFGTTPSRLCKLAT